MATVATTVRLTRIRWARRNSSLTRCRHAGFLTGASSQIVKYAARPDCKPTTANAAPSPGQGSSRSIAGRSARDEVAPIWNLYSCLTATRDWCIMLREAQRRLILASA